MKNLLKKSIIPVITLILLLGGAYQYFYEKPVELISLGSPVIKTAGLGVYRIAGSGISSSATSVTLTSLTLTQNDYPIQDSDLSDTFYMTLEPGDTNRQEFVSCTTVGTNTGGNVTISGCTRGISPISPYTASSTLQFSHSGGAKAIFSNSPSLYDQATFKGNAETISGLWTFASTSIPTLDVYVAPTLDAQLAPKKYMDDAIIAGGTDGGFATKGIYEQATQIEMASSTGAIGSQKALTALYATSTPTVRGLYIPVSENDGFLSQLWLDLTENFAFSGTNTFSGTQTFSGENTFTATSTMATTTVTDFTASGDSSLQTVTSTTLTNSGTASTTDMIISGTQTGGAMTYTASSTAFTVASGTATYTGSIPTTANNGMGKWKVNNSIDGDYKQGTFVINRTGLTTFQFESSESNNNYIYTVTWSGANFVVQENSDSSTLMSLSGTVYWYK